MCYRKRFRKQVSIIESTRARGPEPGARGGGGRWFSVQTRTLLLRTPWRANAAVSPLRCRVSSAPGDCSGIRTLKTSTVSLPVRYAQLVLLLVKNLQLVPLKN